MGYNSGVVTLFNQNASVSNLFASQNNSVFNKPSAPVWTSLNGQTISPTLLTSAAGSVSFAYGQQIFGSISSSTTISFVYGLNIDVSLLAGTVSNAYNLYVSPPTTTSGTITNLFTAFFGLPSVGTNQGGVGIGTTTPTNALDVSGGVALGSYAGSQTISFGVVAISNSNQATPCVGVRTGSPNYYMDVQGTLQAGAAYGWMPMGVQQKAILSQGWGQSGLGGGSVGTNKGLNTNTISFVNPQTVSSLSANFFSGSIFDGRYIYFLPGVFFNSATPGILTRYDTALNFTSATSFSAFQMMAVNSLASQMNGGCFDGRYVYMLTNQITFLAILNFSLIRYDTWLPFDNVASYLLFDTRNINSNMTGLITSLFDGRYIYIGSANTTLFVRYDTFGSFTSPSSYIYFDISRLNSLFNNYIGGLGFDGRFVYLSGPSGATSNYLVSYDTSLIFTNSVSYALFDLSQVSGLSANAFFGAAFEGRYMYFAPFGNSFGFFSGQILQYDTTLSFTSSLSYAFLDLQPINNKLSGFRGATYDGRYVYFNPGDLGITTTGNGILARYDTFMPFNITAGFDFLDFSVVNSQFTAFNGSTFDGRYVYFASGPAEVIIRVDAYPGPQLSTLFASNQASNGFTLGMGITNPITSPTVSSGSIQIPSLPVGYIQLQGGQNIIRKIPYYN